MTQVAPSDVYLAVPTAGTLRAATVERLVEVLRDNRGVVFDCKTGSNLSVAQSRNAIVKRFLASTKTVLAMVDSDIVPPPHFLTMCNGLGQVSGTETEARPFGMVCCPHPMPTRDGKGLGYGIFESVQVGDAAAYRMIAPVGGLHTVDGVATGCVVISREALEAVIASNMGYSDVFRIPDDPDAPITSEDFLLCEDLSRCGFATGYWWDGWHCDHHTVTSLGSLIAAGAAREVEVEATGIRRATGKKAIRRVVPK